VTVDKSSPYLDKVSDAVSRPTKPYVEMSFGMGKDGFPAISMTQHGANKYCQWLSAKTGQFYRLPTEAEWEYACRAGTTTAYSFGDDPAQLGDYAWYKSNNDGSLTFSLDEIHDLPSFAAKLKEPAGADAVSQYLRNQFSSATRKLLSDYGSGSNLKLQRALVEDLDRIIHKGPIYTAQRFASVELSEQTSDLLKQKPEGENLIRLNRTLLHETYPKEIAKSDSDPKEKYHKVGLKRPNSWGLYDMHGNVAEWTLDQYDADYYKQFADTVAKNLWNKATKPYPHVARGGSWDDPPDLLRSAARLASSKSWKVQDPQLPKSIWYHTDAQFLGFRIIRPLKVPPPEELQKYWTSGVEKD
jgi:formylglycine-generating enzyme required for sulfatase activity